MKKSEKLLLAVKNGILIPLLINAAWRRMPIQIVTNQSVRNILAYYRGYSKLERKYHKMIESFPEKERTDREIPKRIWIFWNQGLDNAPDLVKVCYRSICTYMHDYDIRFLDTENMHQYVEIPEHIMEKYELGIITHAHFSDYLRVSLLTKYGGVWIDSTVLCTGNVDFNKMCAGGGIFVFKDRRGAKWGSVISSWLIAASRDSNILQCIKYLMEEYWKRNNYQVDYFLFHMLFALAAKRFPVEWERIPTFTNDVPHILSTEIEKPYTKERFSQLCGMSNFHKLTLRINAGSMPKGSFYDVLVRNGCNA